MIADKEMCKHCNQLTSARDFIREDHAPDCLAAAVMIGAEEGINQMNRFLNKTQREKGLCLEAVASIACMIGGYMIVSAVKRKCPTGILEEASRQVADALRVRVEAALAESIDPDMTGTSLIKSKGIQS